MSNRKKVGAQWVWLGLATSLLLAWLLVRALFSGADAPVSIPYTLFRTQVSTGNVSEITVSGDRIEGRFDQGVDNPNQGEDGRTVTRFETRVPAFGGEALMDRLAEREVTVRVEPSPSGRPFMLDLLIGVVPSALLLGALLWFYTRGRRAEQAGLPDLAGDRAKRYVASATTPRTTFRDVAGIEDVQEELTEIVDYLKHPEKYRRLGAAIPKGVLLSGPPGTGKTLLARAVAGEAGVPFFSMAGSEFVEMIVGVGAARVRKLFERARRERRAIVFIDELDAVGRRRGADANIGGNEEREQTLNQLLIEMDGFDPREAVVVIAATNRPDVLDPALLRPGRFDRRVAVQPPDRRGREAILAVHARSVPLDPGFELGEIAAATPGLVGADLRNLVNEAALHAARRGRESVRREDLFSALEKITLGAERRLVLDPEDRRRIAYHEAGHALAGLLVPDADPVRKVTIIPRGSALGVTYQVPDDDRCNYTEPYLRSRLVGVLAGRAAEKLTFGTVSTGAENDLKQATALARAMVTRWGMCEVVGALYLEDASAEGPPGSGGEPLGHRFGHGLADVIDRQIHDTIDRACAQADTILERERPLLDALAEALLAEETLDERRIYEVVGLPNCRRLITPLGTPALAG